MSKIVLYMWTSLDGFIAGPEDGPDRGLGIGGDRLHDFLTVPDGDPASARADDDVGTAVMTEAMRSGAVLTGRKTFEYAGQWNGDHHDGVPIFVLSRREPDRELSRWPLVTYVDDVSTAMSEAKGAAGERDVLVHGAATAQLALAAGVLDELEIHLIPVLLGQGRRLFDHLRPEHVELERTRVLEGEDGVTHLHYRVKR
jgi:dihydrofolate reductase